MIIGIEDMGFYTPNFYIDLIDLANYRSIDKNKYLTGLQQSQISVCPPDEDVVTMSANLLYQKKFENVDMVIFATESSIDQSKSAGIFMCGLLKDLVSKNCRQIEIKQACYGGTAALKIAIDYVKTHKDKKVLVIAADISRYGLNTPGEPTQGAGAIFMLISSDPKIISFDEMTSFEYRDVMDFWRPNYQTEAIVDGKFSCNTYLDMLENVFENYNGEKSDIYDFCFHTPVPKLALRGYKKISHKYNQYEDKNELKSTIYPSMVGNCYNASLYLSFMSLLENDKSDLTGKKIGFYSYGSGAVAEFFCGVILKDYIDIISDKVSKMINSRKKITIMDYEKFFLYDKNVEVISKYTESGYRFCGIQGNKRIYDVNTN